MSFANPIAWFLALAAGPIIVFYILKLRLRRVPVSTNLFWKQIYDEKPPRSIWQYLRHLLSLLVQLALVALLAAAVADPYFAWQLLMARRIVAVIDNSASMRATDVEPTRLQAAIRSATTLIESLRFRDEMAIVLVGPRPVVVVGMSDHVPTLKRALTTIAASDNPTAVAPAIELGRQLIGDHPHGQVVVFSDGCWENLPLTETESAPVPQSKTASTDPGTAPSVEYRIFGARSANVGITQFQVRRSLIDPLGYEILVAVRNASDGPIKCRVELELAGAPVDILPLTLKPEEVWSRSLEKTSLEGGYLVAKLTQVKASNAVADGDQPRASKTPLNALAIDDTAWAVLPARAIQRVLLVTQGNLFLQKVLEANPLVQVEVRKDFPKQWPQDAIVVLHREIPPTLPLGNVFVVDPAGSCDAWDLGEVMENPIVTELDTDSPLMTHVRLDNVLMPEAKQLHFKTPPKLLASALSKDPIYAELGREGGKALVLTVNLDRGDLAFRTAFPIMVANSLGWFTGHAGELRESLSTGTMAAVELPSAELAAKANGRADGHGHVSVSLRSPDGTEHAMVQAASQDSATKSKSDIGSSNVPSEAAISIGPFDQCGIWKVTKPGAGLQASPLAEFAVNLSNARESDLRPPPDLLQQSQRNLWASGWLARPVWFYLLCAAFALFVTEWILYQRRVIT
jgi:hypothetical protein